MTYENVEEESARERQSRVSKEGAKWENYVRSFLNEKLDGTGIEVINGKKEEEIKKRSLTLWKMLAIPARMSTVQDFIWGDIDLVAVKSDFPIAIISCKLSLHGRFTETLFWGLLFRTSSRIKVVLATPDVGRGKIGEWKSEWGTLDKPTKDRLLAESYLDGVYVENLKEFCKNMRGGEGTIIGGIVRPLNELPADIIRWEKDLSRFIYKSSRSLNSFC
ncbi:MAG: BsaWI family type II restriction enzyme [Candidatus Bathyarchaeia archaeon]